MRLDRFFFLKSIAVLTVSLGSVLPASAYFEKGGVAGIGARPLGMGGAFCTIADDSNAVYYNPAGLIQVFQPEVSGMGAAIFNGKLLLGNLSYIQPSRTNWSGLSTIQQFGTDARQEKRAPTSPVSPRPCRSDKTISVGSTSSSSWPTRRCCRDESNVGHRHGVPCTTSPRLLMESRSTWA
jgi:hypothetical protein